MYRLVLIVKEGAANHSVTVLAEFKMYDGDLAPSKKKERRFTSILKRISYYFMDNIFFPLSVGVAVGIITFLIVG